MFDSEYFPLFCRKAFEKINGISPGSVLGVSFGSLSPTSSTLPLNTKEEKKPTEQKRKRTAAVLDRGFLSCGRKLLQRLKKGLFFLKRSFETFEG